MHGVLVEWYRDWIQLMSTVRSVKWLCVHVFWQTENMRLLISVVLKKHMMKCDKQSNINLKTQFRKSHQ